MIPWPNTWSLWAHYDDALLSGPRDTSPSYGVTNPSLGSCQPNRRFRRYPKCTFIATQLRCDVWHTQSIPTVSRSSTTSWSKEQILDIGKALANELYDLVLCLGLGHVHHVILLMTWSRCQWHLMSIVRKPWLSVDQQASQLEAQ